MIKAHKLLPLIGYTEPTTFSELCNALGDDKPEERSEWAELFSAIEKCEEAGYIEIERGGGGRISSLQLTEEGVDMVRSYE